MTDYQKITCESMNFKYDSPIKLKENHNEKKPIKEESQIKKRKKISIKKKNNPNFVVIKEKKDLPIKFFDDLLALEYLFILDPDRQKYLEITDMLIKAVEHYNNIEDLDKLALFNRKLQDHLINTKIPKKEKSHLVLQNNCQLTRNARYSSVFVSKNLERIQVQEAKNYSDDEDFLMINGSQDNFRNILPARIIKRNFLKFKAKYLEDKESKYKLFCKNLNLKKLIANGKQDHETDDLNSRKNYRIRYQNDDEQGELNEESKNEFLEDAYKNLSEKFSKEQENQFMNAEKILNNDLDTQESNFKSRLKRKLESQKFSFSRCDKGSINSSRGKRLSANDDSLHNPNSLRKLSSPLGSPERNSNRVAFNTTIHKTASAQINFRPRGTVVLEPKAILLSTKTFVRKPSISNNFEVFFNKFHSVFKENFNNALKNVVEIEREKYEKKIQLGTRNLDENIEVDLIFNEEASEDNSSTRSSTTDRRSSRNSELNEKYESYLILKKTIEENFKQDMQECVDVSNKEIDQVINRNRNTNLNRNEKINQLKNNLLEGFKKLL